MKNKKKIFHGICEFYGDFLWRVLTPLLQRYLGKRKGRRHKKRSGREREEKKDREEQTRKKGAGKEDMAHDSCLYKVYSFLLVAPPNIFSLSGFRKNEFALDEFKALVK
jgi:hypothetical protein